MRIVHFAPFAPCACGLYEAARDMVVADRRTGHDAHLVDVGPTIKDGSHTDGKSGQSDARGGTEIVTAEPGVAFYADVIVAHTGIPDNWIVQCQAPIVWVLHGRPGACFRPEQFGNGNSYTLMATLATWPRVKAIVTFWPHHIQFWKPVISEGKLICFPVPPIDESRFSSDGPRHDFKELGGKFNVMLADSWREDIDIYEITHGAIEFAKTRGDVKFHFYGVQTPLRCWEFLFAELRRLGALGEVWGQRPNIEEIYRAADILLSPQRIVTRIVGEALSCGTPVIAAEGCDSATWTAKPDDPVRIAETIGRALSEIETAPAEVTRRVRESAAYFALGKYNERMNAIYERVMR